MWLILAHPKVAYRSCDSCRKWQYDEKTGSIEQHRGEDLLRVLPDKTPCRTPKGCPKGTPEESKELSMRNLLAYNHYKQCKAVGRFPNDPIVERNAGIIYDIEETHRRMQQEGMREMMIAALTARV